MQIKSLRLRAKYNSSHDFAAYYYISTIYRYLYYHEDASYFKLGLATKFRSEKIPRNRLRTASVIPRKKVLIPRHSEVYGRV
jgi:hypothetical protein